MKVFVSYRRSDTQDFAGRLADRLRSSRGIHEVFFDVAEIGAGEDFAQRITTALAASDACVIVIGRDWCGGRRIFKDNDFVRLEVRGALAGENRVLPVLANGAVMPGPENMPEDVRRLTALNALSIRHSDFERDVEHLLDAIFQRKKPGAVAQFFRRNPLLSLALLSLGGALIALVVLVVLLAVFNSATGLSLDQATGGPGAALVLIGVVVVLGAALPWYLRRKTLLG